MKKMEITESTHSCTHTQFVRHILMAQVVLVDLKIEKKTQPYISIDA